MERRKRKVWRGRERCGGKGGKGKVGPGIREGVKRGGMEGKVVGQEGKEARGGVEEKVKRVIGGGSGEGKKKALGG